MSDDEMTVPSQSQPSAAPAAEGVAVEVELEDGQLAYECNTWAGESRGLFASLLSSRGIAHAWQGTTVTVHEGDEEAVDDLVDEVLASARPALDPTAVRVVYEVGMWPVSLQTMLVDDLAIADVSYEWDEQGNLVVSEADEDEVEAIISALPEPDDDEIASDDGVAVHELLDKVFMSSDRLVKHPTDASATVAAVEAATTLHRLAVPFGFEPSQWRRLVGAAAALAVAIDPSLAASDDATVADSDAGATDEQISEFASAARAEVRQYI